MNSRSSPVRYVRQPVCVGYTGFETKWARQFEVVRVGNRHYEGEIRVLHAGENRDDFRSGTRIPIHCFRPDGQRVYVHRCTGCRQQYDTSSIRVGSAPGARDASQKLGTRTMSTTSPVFGRDQIETFVYSVLEIGHRPAGCKPCFAGSQTRRVLISTLGTSKRRKHAGSCRTFDEDPQ